MNLALDYETRLVFYTRTTFRRILDAMARPGKVVSVEPFPLERVAMEDEGNRILLGLGYALLDVEVSFHVIDGETLPSGLAEDMAFRTGSRRSSLDEADFIFMTAVADPEPLTRIKRGNLDYPDTGATVVMILDYLGEEGPSESGEVVEVLLKGPGILREKSLWVGGWTERHIQTLRGINAEFPLGIDLILVWGDQVACIPRSTGLDVRRK